MITVAATVGAEAVTEEVVVEAVDDVNKEVQRVEGMELVNYTKRTFVEIYFFLLLNTGTEVVTEIDHINGIQTKPTSVRIFEPTNHSLTF